MPNATVACAERREREQKRNRERERERARQTQSHRETEIRYRDTEARMAAGSRETSRGQMPCGQMPCGQRPAKHCTAGSSTSQPNWQPSLRCDKLKNPVYSGLTGVTDQILAIGCATTKKLWSAKNYY